MTRWIRAALCGWLAAQAAAAAAELMPSAMVAAPSLPFRAQPMFIGAFDSDTGQGDVWAMRGDGPDATTAWRASDHLPPRHVDAAASRQISLAPGWDALADRLQHTPFGAIVNANLWYVAGRGADRPAMLYAGSTDGMLHALDAASGQERFAHVPRGLLPRLNAGTRGAAVDGPVFGGEAAIGPSAGVRPLVAAALGSGGKGLFVIDAATPGTLPGDRVVVDLTDREDPDLGHITGPPVLDDARVHQARHVVRLHDGRPALVFGNGHGSQSGRPVLLIQYLDLARELVRISPCPAAKTCGEPGDQGLAMPRLVDLDGDGQVDMAYAGDLQGRLWKFDLQGPRDRWHVASGGQPFFTACSADGLRQPITTAPYAAPHPRGGWMVVVGTGRHLVPADATDRRTQSIYGLHDEAPLGPAAPWQAAQAACDRSAVLAERWYGPAVAADAVDYHRVTGTGDHQAAGAARHGWWIDLPVGGQRVLQNPQLFEGHKLLVHSVVPSGRPGHPRTHGQAYLSVLNLLTGHAPAHPPFAVGEPALGAEPVGMVRLPSEQPWLLQRRAGQRVQLQSARGDALRLSTARTTGARAGWRDRR